MSSLDLLIGLQQLITCVSENESTVTTNAYIKRIMIKKMKEGISPTLSIEDYNDIVNNILELLDNSSMDEDFLIEKINSNNLFINNSLNVVNICTIIHNSIQNEIIKTGSIDNPGVGGGEENPHHAMEAALFGVEDIYIDNTNKDNIIEQRLFNIPTDKEKSPSIFTVNDITYDVSMPFTQQMVLLEELGRIDIDNAKENNLFTTNLEVPPPSVNGYIDKENFEIFMKNICSTNLGFEPTKESNTHNPNPWHKEIKCEIYPKDFIEGVAEGRAPGKYGQHQKWTDNNPPKMISITCQTGASANTGERDSLQMHKYEVGEFGQDGLYHKVFNTMDNSCTTKNVYPQFHINLPRQNKESLWTFDGSFPPKLLMAKYGEPHILRHYNLLPIRADQNRGFGLHTITTHEHNGPNNGISDGFAQSFFFPGEYYDYWYSLTLAGHTYMNLDKSNNKASIPMDWKRDTNGVPLLDNNNRPIPEPNINIAGDWKETMSTHWFHDHMLDYTAQNVYKGNAAMMNYYSAIDRGNEEIDDGVNLRFPSGTDLSWGNRDYDVNIMIMDKAWDNEGQLWFNPFNTTGFLGDRMLVNWILEPYFEVRARRYRFRILNSSVSRFMKLAIVRKYNDIDSGHISGPPGSETSYEEVPFWLIANDGNILMHTINFDGTNGTSRGILPVIAIAERFDIVVDFSKFAVGDKLYFVNVLEHHNGKRPNKEIPLSDILNNTYSGDPCVMKFMEFRIMEYTGTDLSMNPSLYEVRGSQMIPIEPINEAELAIAKQRNFNFVNKEGTVDEWAIETDGGDDFQMDPRRLSAAPTSGKLEIWTFRNGALTWAHNIHHHFAESKILLRDDQLPPIWEQFARKDVIRVGGKVDSSETVVLVIKFLDVEGDQYMLHCHNTQHEDHAMLLRFDVMDNNCVKTLPCPFPTWNGVKFLETKTLPTYRTGMKKDNLFYNNPAKLLYKLRQIDKIVPDSDTGSYFVNGIGKNIQLYSDD